MGGAFVWMLRRARTALLIGGPFHITPLGQSWRGAAAQPYRIGTAGGGGVVDPVSAGFQVAGQGVGFGGSGLCGGEDLDAFAAEEKGQDVP